MKSHKTLFVIADGGHVRFVSKRIGEMAFDTVREIVADNRHDHSHDHSGRVHESATSARHGIEARHHVNQLRKEDFLRAIGEELNKARRRGEFERLVLVAPARPLGQLVNALDLETEASVVSRLRKDLTRVPDGHLHEHLAEIVYAWRVMSPSAS
ncbi:MAG: host attachment protein [Sphingomonadales bacterium]